MNILIVGNGFDLSHYLPTKYDHFMDVMRAIEKKDLGKPIQDVFKNPVDTLPELILKILEIKKLINPNSYEMNFDNLFGECREKSFITKTKEIYHTSAMQLSFEQIVELQFKLQKNIWYQYFSHHVREIKTWIDFETKINEALKAVAIFIFQINKKVEEGGVFSDHICHVGECSRYQIFLRKEYCKILEQFKFLTSGYYKDEEDSDEYGRYFSYPVETGDDIQGDLRFYINTKIISDYSEYKKINDNLLLDDLQEHLDDFVEIFNTYLEVVIDELIPKYGIKIQNNDWITPDKIYSFNYTNSFLKFYKLVPIEFLHGSLGEKQNIVLGVSDVADESLKKLKAYGFTKYHQKLFKDTDYLFLDEFKKKIQQDQKQIEILGKKVNSALESSILQFYDKQLDELEKNQNLNLNFYIWGHSLDTSDKDYIIDLFSLNDDMDRNVQVIIYYFDKNAKFTLLNNLLAILGKDKVEQWMKNEWLQFKSNPEIKFTEAIL